MNRHIQRHLEAAHVERAERIPQRTAEIDPAWIGIHEQRRGVCETRAGAALTAAMGAGAAPGCARTQTVGDGVEQRELGSRRHDRFSAAGAGTLAKTASISAGIISSRRLS